MQHITQLDDERITPFRSLRNLKSAFVTEGKKGVEALFASSIKVKALLFEPKHTSLALEYQQKDPDLILYVAPEGIVSQIVGYKMHQGIMALADIPPNRLLSELDGPAVVLQGLANAENVGAILRSCAAFGFQNVICDEACSPLYIRRTVKTSMGALFDLNTFKSEAITRDLIALKAKGYQVIGADPNRANIPLDRVDKREKFLLVIGSEGEGIASEVKEVCDQLVCIPIDKSIDSLNAAIATSIFLYHFNQV